MVTDLTNMSKFVCVQVEGGGDKAAVLSVQFDATRKRMQANDFPISTEQAVEIGGAINAGPWAPEQKQALHSVVNELLASSSANSKRRGMQKLKKFENFQTDPEWKSIRNRNVARQARIAQVANRAWSLGLTCPSEKDTSLRIAVIIALCEGVADDAEIDEIYDDFKAAVKSCAEARKYPHEHLLNYPSSPFDLPKHMFEFAYGEDRPIEVLIPELDGIMSKLSCRNKAGSGRKKGDSSARSAENMLEDLKILQGHAAKKGFEIVVKKSGRASHESARGKLDQLFGSGAPAPLRNAHTAVHA